MTNDCNIVVIPDVHGCYHLLNETLKMHYNSGAELIFLGDLIDRSPDINGDRKVLTLVRRLQDNPADYGLSKVTVLRGNHEQLCIDALTGDLDDYELWLTNGGNPKFFYYLKEHPEHLEWMKGLPYYTIRGEYLFVHAGVMPGVPLDQQDNFNLLWIRHPFLTQPHGLPYTVVHGHTIQDSDEPVFTDDRIALDLGAFATGKLCTLSITNNAS